MAVIKIYRIKNLTHNKNLARYVTENREYASAKDCSPENFVEDFRAIANIHEGKGHIEAYHIVQSWNEEESKQFSPAEFNKIGVELAENYFNGHAFVVATHADKANLHNHIIVNPWNTETGVKIENKKYHLYKLRDLNDRLCQERGLSVIARSAKEARANLPDKVWQMTRFNSRSFLVDLINKADFARAYATSHDEYAGILSELGITAKVENKNIVYFYPGHERGKRGSKLGKNYDKDGLEQAYKSNDQRFRQYPGLRQQIKGQIENFKADNSTIAKVKETLSKESKGTYEPGLKDYSKFTYIKRRDHERYPHELELGNSVMPIEELRRARRGNIIEYCKVNNIKLKQNEKGELTLAGREYVTVSEREWSNKKNRTKGSLIEFVAAHKGMTFIQAISEINKNPRLLLLEKHFGEQKSTFTSFYIPKEKRMEQTKAEGRLNFFLRGHGIEGSVTEKLLASNRVQIDKSGMIKLFSEDDKEGAIDFSMDSDNKWSRKTQGSFKSPFFSFKGFGTKANVFIDPLCFIKHRGKDLFKTSDLREPTICLMEPDERPMDIFISNNRNIKKLRFIVPDAPKRATHEWDFITKLKDKYKPLGIEIEHGSIEKPLPDRDLEIPFY